MKGYGFEISIQVRWRDLDAFAHVNNAVFATYLEIARTEFWRKHFAIGETVDFPFFLVRLEVDFRRPLGLGAETRVGVRVGTIGGSSFSLEYLVEADGVAVAEAATTQVIVDRKSGRPMRMEAGMRAKLEALRGSGEE
ncbi:MAG: acyl-CoA thioesterase [Acidobacteria bacterium]|nr:acyl-CoA thioesterase [Acidobacteriota bacterium]